MGPAPPAFMEKPEYGLHEHTVDQELRTLCNRHLFLTPEPDLESKAWTLFKRAMRDLSKLIGYVPKVGAAEVLKTRPAMKRRRFGKGMERYCREGVKKQDSYLTEMQKLEFYAEDKLAGKEDRGIQFRSPTYNAALARHLHLIEKKLYASALNYDGTPMIAKGRSPLERGMILAAMAENYSRPLFILMDHSRFDAHVDIELLKEEHRFYNRARGYDEELEQLLKHQLKGYGFTSSGIVYRIKGKRASGDLNTALGNSLLNLAMIKSWLAANNIKKYHILLDGDDSVVVLEDEYRHLIDTIPGHMLNLGMKTEVQTTNELEHAEFCQGRVCWGTYGPVMVRNPHKVLDVLTKSPKILTERQACGVLAASALGELMMAPGVPVIAPAAARLFAHAGGKPLFTSPDSYYKFQLYEAKEIRPKVDPKMRESFEFAWGITVPEQMAIEAHYEDLGPPATVKPIVKPPRAKDLEDLDIWDDTPFEHAPFDIDPWWRRKWPIGDLLGA